MAKIPDRVGREFPQVVVLVGATGDLARRKLLPGLFHLSNAGFIPGCQIIGVSLADLDPDGFREISHAAIEDFFHRKVNASDWEAFARALTYVPLSAGPAALKAAVKQAEESLDGESRRLHYLSVPPSAALSAVAASPGPAPSVSSPPAPTPAAAVGANDWVTAHNEERNRVGTPPLVWDDGLAAVAAAWADKRAREVVSGHSDTRGVAACNGSCGENVAMIGGATSYSAKDAVGQWLKERPYWDSQKASIDCLGGQTCGHYTQVISQLSTRVGCAIAKGERYSAGFK